MEVEATPGHLALLTLDHEIELARYVRSKEGGLMYGPLLYRSAVTTLFRLPNFNDFSLMSHILRRLLAVFFVLAPTCWPVG